MHAKHIENPLTHPEYDPELWLELLMDPIEIRFTLSLDYDPRYKGGM
jgi:hypothetical protein